MELMFLFCEWGRLQIRVVLAHAKKNIPVCSECVRRGEDALKRVYRGARQGIIGYQTLQGEQ